MDTAHEWNGIRREVAEYCLDNNISEEDFRFVKMYEWQNIYQKVLDAFVDKQYALKNGLYWANVNNGFSKEIVFSFRLGTKGRRSFDWIYDLPKLVNCDKVYLLLEESGQTAKYWIAECSPRVIGSIINDTYIRGDHFIVDKKYRWLITENHHEVVIFLGDGLDIGSIEEICCIKE